MYCQVKPHASMTIIFPMGILKSIHRHKPIKCLENERIKFIFKQKLKSLGSMPGVKVSAVRPALLFEILCDFLQWL
jgi:hypothetical protein